MHSRRSIFAALIPRRIIEGFIFMALLLPFSARADTIESRYFTLVLPDQTAAQNLLARLGAVELYQLDAVLAGRGRTDLSRFLDALYLEVCDIMDINLYDFKTKISVLPDEGALAGVIKEKTGRNVTSPAFYLHGEKTIFAVADTLTPGILAHEIAHALIMRYFIVPPPEKLQEVMCGYVEYSINRKSENAAD